MNTIATVSASETGWVIGYTITVVIVLIVVLRRRRLGEEDV